jgi:uncharacterized SAM-binding protein YcdF (DUF218 family)
MARRVIVGAAITIVVTVVIATAVLFVWPSSDSTPRKADAVVVLSGGRGDRLPTGLRLMQDGVAPVLVISNGLRPKWRAGRHACLDPHPFVVLCPQPHPDTTQGEAEVLGRLAKQNRWQQVVVVTSRYHVTRAGLLVRRCVKTNVAMVASTPRDPAVSRVRQVFHEWLGLADALALRRAC